MVAYAHTIGDYGMNARNFGIIRLIRTLLSMVQLGSNRLKMVYVKASHASAIWGLYFLRSKFPCFELFRYLQAVVSVSNLRSFSTFLEFSISVIYLAIFWQRPLFSRSSDDVRYFLFYLVCLLFLLFYDIIVFPWCSDNHVC